LQDSLNGIRITNPHTDAEWGSLLDRIIADNEGDDQYIYLHITRGVAKRDHAFPKGVLPTVFIMSNPLMTPPKELLATGVDAITAIDNRWLRCDIKAISLLPNVLLRQMAIDVGAVETILIREGFMTEGAASNIFVVRNNALIAPPKNHLMLPGITYDIVLELAAANGIPYEVRKVSEYEIRNSQELLLTSSTKEIMPITRLDGKNVGDGAPGSMFKRLYQLYQTYKNTVMRGDTNNN
jgi:D-alanine transaminase